MFNLHTLFRYSHHYIIFGLVIINLLVATKLYQAYYPLFFYGITNIFVFLAFRSKKDLKYFLFLYQIYFLLSMFIIKLDIAHLVGYSDQFMGYTSVSTYYFDGKYDYLDVLFNNIDFEFYQMEIIWNKIFYLLKYISIGSDEVALFFNFSLYFLASIFAYKSLYHLFSIDTIAKSFFAFIAFSPPALFINSLYLKESITMSTIIFLTISLYRKKYIFVLISSILLFKLRSSYFVLFLLIYLLIKSFYIQRKILRYCILSMASFIVIAIFYVAIQLNINNKLFNYLDAASNGVELKNTTATATNFLDKDNLLSLRNLVVVPILGILSPSPTRFIKSKDTPALLESLFVSIFWWTVLPFFILFLLLNTHFRLKEIMLSMFLTIFLAASFSLLSIAPEPFRYRLPIYGILMIGGYIGYYLYSTSIKKIYLRKYLFIWFSMTSIIYLMYAII